LGRVAVGALAAAGLAWACVAGAVPAPAPAPVLVATDGAGSWHELVGVAGGAALLWDEYAGRLEEGSTAGSLHTVWIPPHNTRYKQVLAGDAQALVVSDYRNSGAGDEQTSAGAQLIGVAPLAAPTAATPVAHCGGVDLNLGDPMPAPPFAFDGATVALTEDCAYDTGTVGPGVLDADVVDTATTPATVVRLKAPGAIDGLALAGSLVAVRSGATVLVEDRATAAVARTLALPGSTQPQSYAQPLALARDGTVYATALARGQSHSCGPVGALVKYAPGSVTPVTLAREICNHWPITLTGAGLLYVRPDTTGIAQLVLAPAKGGTARVLVSFRNPIGVFNQSGNLTVGDEFIGAGGGFDFPISWPFEYAAAGHVVAYRVPGCTSLDQFWLAAVGQRGPASTAASTPAAAVAAPRPCAVRLDAFHLDGDVATVTAHCVAGCLGAWLAWVGPNPGTNERLLRVAAGHSVTLTTRVACAPGETSRVHFDAGIVNGLEVLRSWRVRCP